MRSSTSSSRPAAPSGAWFRTWAVALVLVAAASAGLESLARRWGVRPSWSAGLESWCAEASELQPRDIVVLGTSRALSGIEPGTLSRGTGRPVRHLPINATSLLPALEWLASREDFAGSVIAEVLPGLEFRAGFERHTIAERFVAALPDFRRSPARRIDAALSRFVQTRVAFRSPGFHLLAPYRDREGRGIARLSRMSVESTRFVRLEFQPGDPDAPERTAESVPPQPAGRGEFENLMGRFARAARSIERRGGRVTFLFMPLSGSAAESEERSFPRSRYWDRLAAGTGALKVHFKDEPALAGFECPDGEHLDGEDAVRFTRSLAELLVRRGGL